MNRPVLSVTIYSADDVITASASGSHLIASGFSSTSVSGDVVLKEKLSQTITVYSAAYYVLDENGNGVSKSQYTSSDWFHVANENSVYTSPGGVRVLDYTFYAGLQYCTDESHHAQ